METVRIAFLVLALGAFILAGVLTYNLLSTPDYAPAGQATEQQYVQRAVYNQPATGPKLVDSVQAYAAFEVLPVR